MKLNVYFFTLFVIIATVFCKSHKSPCKSMNKMVTCANKMLREVPKFPHENETEILDMSGNDMEELFSLDFYGLTQLKYLYLNYNSVEYIEDTAFEDLFLLEYLDLSNNILEDIPENVIVNNKQLITLDLSGNIFNMKTPSIISNSLEVLDLSFSKIAFFDEENLKNLPSLKILNLNSNNLVTLNAEIFTIPEDFLYVELLYNTWKCNCDTIKLFKKLTQNKLTEIKEPVSCVDSKLFIHIFNQTGPISEENYCNKKGEKQTKNIQPQKDITKHFLKKSTSVVIDNAQISNDIGTLEEILKNEKLYFDKLLMQQKVIDYTAFLNTVLIVIVFLGGIGIGIIVSNVKHKKVKSRKPNTFYLTQEL